MTHPQVGTSGVLDSVSLLAIAQRINTKTVDITLMRDLSLSHSHTFSEHTLLTRLEESPPNIYHNCSSIYNASSWTTRRTPLLQGLLTKQISRVHIHYEQSSNSLITAKATSGKSNYKVYREFNSPPHHKAISWDKRSREVCSVWRSSCKVEEMPIQQTVNFNTEK